MNIRKLAAGILLVASQGCATGLLVRPAADDAHLSISQISDDLQTIGYKCKPAEENQAVFCSHEHWFDMIVEPKGDPPRLVHAAVNSLKPGFSCDAIAGKMAALNRDYNLATVYCVAGKEGTDTIVAQSDIVLSSHGHTSADLAAYFKSWTTGVTQMLKDGGLWDAMK